MSDTAAVLLGSLITAVLLYLGTRATNAVTRRRDDKAAKIDERRVDGEAYDRAVKVNKDITDSLQQEMERLQTKVTELSVALDKAIERAHKAEAERDVAVAQLADPRLRVVPPPNAAGSN